ncbi:MAG TPA: M23 family metallopeptidase [Gemmatimonadaceae bacterium]|nr:M23 family metallopeptidase [Gemmatimonadaceae bacterium]
MQIHELSWGLATYAMFALLITPSSGAAQQRPSPPRLTMEPGQAAGGTLVRLTIERAPRNLGDSIVGATGTMAGEPLHFRAAPGGKLEALGAVPIGISDSLVAHVQVERASGSTDSARLFVKYPHQPAPAPASVAKRAAGARRLRVDARFTKRDAENDARVERENELAREIGHKAQDTPAMWTQPFLRPRPSKVTSRFGSGRVFNGRLSSSHLGIDYRGKVGEPIYAANRGVVALVAEFFLAGNVVYIDHGDGLMTAYFHMSQPEVAVGDTVERGQEIGLVGATGRVTGPHLHWSARFGALTIDPADLLSLGPPFVEKGGGGVATGGKARR